MNDDTPEVDSFLFGSVQLYGLVNRERECSFCFILTEVGQEGNIRPKNLCYMPQASNLRVVLHEHVNDSTLNATLYWNNTQKPDNERYCVGSRQWQVNVRTYRHVYDTPEDFASVSNPNPWRNTANRRDTHFAFTGISRSQYYLFQVRNEASHLDQPTNNPIAGNFSSHIYYFGEQGLHACW